MKLVEAESKLRLVEREIEIIFALFNNSIEFGDKDLDILLSELSNLLSTKSKLTFAIDEAKIINKFDDSKTLKEAELLKKELEDRAEINSSILSLLAKKDSPISISVSEYYGNASRMRKLSIDIEEKLSLLKYTIEVNIV